MSSSNRRAWSPGPEGSRRKGEGNQNGGGYRGRVAERELDRLEESFYSMMEHVKAQKLAAQKWIRRQHIRMEVRLDFPLRYDTALRKSQ